MAQHTANKFASAMTNAACLPGVHATEQNNEIEKIYDQIERLDPRQQCAVLRTIIYSLTGVVRA